jgi:hypothetical protein
MADAVTSLPSVVTDANDLSGCNGSDIAVST